MLMLNQHCWCWCWYYQLPMPEYTFDTCDIVFRVSPSNTEWLNLLPASELPTALNVVLNLYLCALCVDKIEEEMLSFHFHFPTVSYKVASKVYISKPCSQFWWLLQLSPTSKIGLQERHLCWSFQKHSCSGVTQSVATRLRRASPVHFSLGINFRKQSHAILSHSQPQLNSGSHRCCLGLIMTLN